MDFCPSRAHRKNFVVNVENDHHFLSDFLVSDNLSGIVFFHKQVNKFEQGKQRQYAPGIFEEFDELEE